MVMDGDVQAMETGDSHDFGGGDLHRFPPVHVARELHDGDTVRLGKPAPTAHKTAGHTRGCTAWTMQVMDEGHTRNVLIIGGFAALDSYRLIDLRDGRRHIPESWRILNTALPWSAVCHATFFWGRTGATSTCSRSWRGFRKKDRLCGSIQRATARQSRRRRRASRRRRRRNADKRRDNGEFPAPGALLALDRNVSVQKGSSLRGRLWCVRKVSHLVEMSCFPDTRRDAEA